LVVAVAVAASAFSGQRTIEELGRDDAAARKRHGELAIQRESDLLTQKVAATVAIPLANNTFSDVQLLLDQARRDAERPGDRRIQWMLVTDVADQVIARSGPAPDPATLARARLDQVAPGQVARTRAGTDWIYASAIALGKTVIGRLHMGVSTAALDAELAASIEEVEERARRSTHTVWLVAAVLFVTGVVLAALQGIGIGRPLRLLARQAEQLANGHFDRRVPENRRDEIGLLAQSFNRMAGDLGVLMLEHQQMAVLERELSLARSVQQSMLPPDVLGRHGHLKIVGHCSPASTCGGDWWTFRGLRSGRLLIVVGDATGHGFHSALVASTARGAVEALAEVDEQLLTPQNVLKSIDSAIRNVGKHDVLMTCFAAVFDPSSARLSYANAGQNFPYVLRMGPGRVLDEADTLTDAGNPLGDRNRMPELRQEGSILLNPGDLFVCFTDGLVQRQNPTGKLFGERRLRSMLQGSVVSPDGNSLVALRDKVLGALDAFASGTMADDDITFVLCQYDPPGAWNERSRRVG
jgi:phosphoserine phosphatase RsbU/P